jgi:hypothetical protein
VVEEATARVAEAAVAVVVVKRGALERNIHQ